ncbi:small ribosomal subunit protein mS23-like isoform X2 [Oncorhynchus clarkii lewisi]|uniref:small ribosomal subunit protein mS23-like isoform X2 n=1 Tax=Oncorhynchus clarkii lewisi TaxID=490388 RepID=UPI0039B82FC2
MAGSRLEKFGTVFTRVRDLMRSGVVKQSDKPIWYDVYKTFPPMKDPLYVRPVAKRYGKKEDAVPDIFYREDENRAKCYEGYGTGPRPFDISKSSFVSTCQRFVEKYTEFESQGELEKQSLFEETGKALLAEGLGLRNRGIPAVASETRNPVLGMKLTDMLAEQQADAPGGTRAPGKEKPTQVPLNPQ